jgi:hypothetical protein
VRRRRRAKLSAAALGCSRGGLTGKVHLAADRYCRPLSFMLTPGQAGDSRAEARGLAGTRTAADNYSVDRSNLRQQPVDVSAGARIARTAVTDQP